MTQWYWLSLIVMILLLGAVGVRFSVKERMPLMALVFAAIMVVTIVQLKGFIS